MTWKGYFEKLLMLLQAIKFVLVERERERERVSFPHIFAKFCRIYSFYNSLAESETNLTPAKLYGLTWEAIKRTSSKHPTKLSRTPLYSHMSSIKACSSWLNQVLIDILYSWYVHSILLLHSFYTSLARRGQFPPNPKHHLFHIFCLYIYIRYKFFSPPEVKTSTFTIVSKD